MTIEWTIEWTRAADGDLDSLAAHIAADDPVAAAAQVLRIVDVVETILVSNPALGRPGRVPGTRELVIDGSPYIVAYRVRGETLQVLRVLHGARRWPDRM